ncbi:hypothetical protein ACQPZP_10035 [Spirillospora sp. CA-142024]|uniref:hypothetical protein n=1 Tax=Spirillospora sp. CA-142024 TaxID=3240036 RepID=UPI003D8E7817
MEGTAARNEWARELMIKHLERHGAELTSAITTRETWQRLGHPDVLDYVVNADLTPPPGRLIAHRNRAFGRLFLVVSHFPTVKYRKIRKELLPSGYLALLDPILHSSGFSAGEVDLGHWMLLKDEQGNRAVTLTYLPANRETIPFLPWDLLSSEERRKVDQFIA